MPSLDSSPDLAEGGSHPGPLFGPLPIKRPSRNCIRGKLFRLKLRQATPLWADKGKIRSAYKEARRLTRETGEQYTVDHVIPLKGETVCGLHVHNNLRIVHERVNRSKGNKVVDQLDMFNAT